MEQQKRKTTPSDFFLHLGVVLSLYAIVSFLLNLLFTVINVAYPRVESYYFVPSISFPVAALIVIFPVFLFLSRLIYKSYELDPEKKHLTIRKWLTYTTLFVTGVVIAGNLITVIFYFLDGRDFTPSFVLKALSVFAILSIVFGYYFNDLKDRISFSKRKNWAVVSAAVVFIAITLGFSVIGSPKTQRLRKIDEVKISDLQSIQNQIVQFWQTKKSLPLNLEDLNDPLSSFYSTPLDPQTGGPYEYRVVSSNSFELCANFNLENSTDLTNPRMISAQKTSFESENWKHKVGEQCFSRTVDSERYPFFSR